MTRNEKNEFAELKAIIEGAFKDKYSPENGWKTARAVFESETLMTLGAIKEATSNIPELISSVKDIQCWRKKINKVLIWFGTSIITPVLLFVIYQALK